MTTMLSQGLVLPSYELLLVNNKMWKIGSILKKDDLTTYIS